MTYDDGGFRQLVEVCEDMHSDGMRTARNALDEAVEIGQEQRAHTQPATDPGRRTFLRKSLFAAGVLGAGIGASQLARTTLLVAADAGSDIEMLQTAASIENLAVAVYTKAASLPGSVSGASNPVILKFVQMTIQQHTDHSNAFNAAISRLGGKRQTGLDMPVYNGVVTPALPKLKGPADVIGLAKTLEDAAAQTYVKFGSSVDDSGAVAAFAAIAPVEAQHVAVLAAVGAIAGIGGLAAVTLPPNLGALPAAAGSLGFPHSFYPLDAARPATEGAVQ
ncbi:MAG TPA: ferritin-like domain-containing protein [Candidatus Dormibacteraeota bacterium]|nr:ferritin-like domain-containing protein [Candidatus Dormibacteraeota bacterium]